MANVLFSPALQAPIALVPALGALAIGGNSPGVAGKFPLVPSVAALSLISSALQMALGMIASSGSIALGGQSAATTLRTVTPRAPSAGAASYAGSAPTVTVSSGGGSTGPVWQAQATLLASDPTRTGTVGVAFSCNLDNYCTDSTPPTYILGGPLPAGLSQSGARGNIISGTPTAVAINFVLTITADDGTAVVVPSWQNQPIL